ncbi:HD-GYP domain, c-di-GMP phosphodiesterase class II (or its inactivated variant) [Modicisalibacter muralis]|uniref:HD-GYP domain, c-di-GMP phosphodiesterase class II (Or its inactivated variant) n=1 Tax=Modicisalibacter muralis TaxID=119000 RepID=A0A1G9PPI0_9GAMM|nr:HD domain-containing phosphohydrolase [Halomonas muralis]SDM00762.1 HD-GYP domain, c-di-GMP phosphodiesterase class II (or its inactivated variant) [Halomonas muralis]
MSETPTVVEHTGEIAALLEAMSQPGGVSLAFEEQTAPPVPVLLVDTIDGQQLILDVTAVSSIAGALTAERAFRLTGQADGAMVTTETLVATPLNDVPGRLRFACLYPRRLDVWHRRNDFRAELGSGMSVAVELDTDIPGEAINAELLNLSLGGCLLKLPLAKAVALRHGQALPRFEAVFPNGQRLAARVEIRHVQTDEAWQRALVGCKFAAPTPRFERLVWFLVQEIERESARKAMPGEDDTRPPSALFQAVPAVVEEPVVRRAPPAYATPMARRLSKIADYLNAQLLQLQQGSPIDSALLSRNSDALLSLLEEDREALLFASVCLHREPSLVQHCLAVAIRLADLAQARNAPRELLKALVATGLVHDLGKALLPDSLRDSPKFDDQQRRQLADHVALIQERLRSCRWLAPAVIKSVIGEANERIDGRGYPVGRSGDELSALSRMAMTVDVIDAMGRPRADRAAWSTEDIYRYLLTHGRTFDSQWVQRYIRHFGLHPIGSLAHFSGGARGWVQRLDRHGLPRQVALISPTTQQRVDGEIKALGSIDSLVTAPSPKLLPRQ